ncbi:metallophosphoesterase family protein [Ectothiorhodospira variabilis]|uniref:metallophosphoesterase family protein n=1 Tax=Ectothiorhodospira variabilis TaxID=505694 RepID=UPI001EFAA113|nr:DNA repair exonuclease [Ectothiorhodospira variabilis]MCG5493947.1 DNA repair exonuclease [Ectothiorhodospira variabilis]MCG5503750.1 DNA repair exonuclease [Ectothiorhodospira variabilis]MCG5506906.1 DNA repair exonuclease [Ectothiorhodospira variabilis]
MNFTFLHAADLHVDSPLKGLDRYEGAPVERLRNATRQALEALVDTALNARVDFLLLAGDIYDRDWQDFHTGLFFREQMVRLERGGVRVFMVQGNHDAQGVISRQLHLPENVTVFSSRTAQTEQLEPLSVAIHGRSFPNRAVDEDWVPEYPAPVAGCFNIGLLHTSLSGRPGHDRYAPTDMAALTAKGYDYWALGHVHHREVVCESPRIVFPGNLQGRHANETGPKGCDLVRVTPAGIQSEFTPLDVVRWHRLTLDVTDIKDIAAFVRRVSGALEEALGGDLERLHAVRVQLTGMSALQDLEARQPGTLEAQVRAAAQDLNGPQVWVEQVRVRLSRPLERGQVAARDDAVGELLRLVDEMMEDPDRAAEFLQQPLAGLLDKIPGEVELPDWVELKDEQQVRDLLLDAESTVLARLGEAGQGES